MNNRKEYHLEWIDALRGFAAMWVIVYHCRVDLWVGFNAIHQTPGAYSAFDRLAAWLSLPTAFGGGAVMLFFVVSGFCVHLPYAAENRPLNIIQYGLRRVLRILPPYLLAVALTCLIERIIFWLGGNAPTPLQQVAGVSLMIQNYGAHGGQLLTNGSLWSVPVEVEFYIVYLLFHYLLRSTDGFLTGTVVATCSLLATMGYLHGVKNLGGNFLHFWAIWCAGALLAEWLKRGRIPAFRTWNGLMVLVLGMGAMALDKHQRYLGIVEYLWGGVYFHVVWLALLYPSSIHKFPDWCVRLFVWLGKVSYSAYLIHFPLFALAGFLWEHFTGGKPANFLVTLFFSVSVWAAAWLSWKFCEHPFHRLSQNLAKRISTDIPVLIQTTTAQAKTAILYLREAARLRALLGGLRDLENRVASMTAPAFAGFPLRFRQVRLRSG